MFWFWRSQTGWVRILYGSASSLVLLFPSLLGDKNPTKPLESFLRMKGVNPSKGLSIDLPQS